MEKTPLFIAGFIILIAGALVTFLSGRLSKCLKLKNANLLVKFVGLGIALAGFAMVMQ